jgi:hypothetical protein
VLANGRLLIRGKEVIRLQGKNKWKGPLADAVKGVSRERIAAEVGCTTATVTSYMTDTEKQKSIGLDFLAALHRLANPRGKAKIEKFINDQLVA